MERQRDGCAARLSRAAVFPHRPAARGAGGALLRRHHERLRSHARLRRSDPRARPLGHHRLHPCPAVEPAGGPGRRSHRRAQTTARGCSMNGADTLRPQLERWQRRALVVGVVSLALCAGGGWMSRGQFFQSYLLGFLFWAGLTLGCFALLLLHQTLGAGWGFVMQRTLEAGARGFPPPGGPLLAPLLGRAGPPPRNAPGGGGR